MIHFTLQYTLDTSISKFTLSKYKVYKRFQDL